MTDYSNYFSSELLMEKIDNLSGGGCCELVKKAITLYVLFKSDVVSPATKVLIVAALGYFICPIDAIADYIPIVGYSDDLTVMALLLTQLEEWVTAEAEQEIQSLLPLGCR